MQIQDPVPGNSWLPAGECDEVAVGIEQESGLCQVPQQIHQEPKDGARTERCQNIVRPNEND